VEEGEDPGEVEEEANQGTKEAREAEVSRIWKSTKKNSPPYEVMGSKSTSERKEKRKRLK